MLDGDGHRPHDLRAVRTARDPRSYQGPTRQAFLGPPGAPRGTARTPDGAIPAGLASGPHLAGFSALGWTFASATTWEGGSANAESRRRRGPAGALRFLRSDGRKAGQEPRPASLDTPAAMQGGGLPRQASLQVIDRRGDQGNGTSDLFRADVMRLELPATRSSSTRYLAP